MEPWIYLLAFLIAFVTMFFGTMSGGVGLVLRPLLIFLGFPAVSVIGSVRLSTISEIPSIFLLHKRKMVDWKLVLLMSIPMFLGSFIAGILVLSVLENILNPILGFLLIAVGILLLIFNKAGIEEKPVKITWVKHIYGFLGTIFLSFINTFTGGMGPLFSSLYIANYGKTYISSVALRKPASIIGSTVAAIVFIIGGVVDWKLFAVLVIGFMLGSLLGTHYGLKKGEKWVRAIVIIVVFATGIKLLFF